MNDIKKVPSFAVLLAAYNGIRWLQSQVESILSQVDVRVTIFISIDPSSDGTEDWFKAVSAHDDRLIVLPVGEKFGGAAKNFFRLIRDVDFSKFDYVSFADQDDVWLLDKLSTAHKKISSSTASAYSCNVTAFWPEGRKLLLDKAQRQRKYDYLFEAAGPGCGYVLKISEALRFKKFLIENWQDVNDVSLHDWLVYAWFRSVGLVWFIDPVPKILYRQHEANQVGANKGLKAIKARLSLLRAGWYRNEVSKIAKLIWPNVQSLPGDLVERGDVSRYFLIFNFNELRRRFRDRIFLAIMIFFGIY